MSSINILQGLAPPRHLQERILQLTADQLLRASAALARASASLSRKTTKPALEVHPLLEFHCESGAPEGALYVDGQLFGWISGTNRL